MTLRPLLTAGLVFGGLVAATAAVEAAPLMAQPGVAQGGLIETVATSRARRMRRMNTMRHGHPNAKNPALQGHQQNLGGTTRGPRH